VLEPPEVLTELRLIAEQLLAQLGPSSPSQVDVV
jgi:hypothetical protein